MCEPNRRITLEEFENIWWNLAVDIAWKSSDYFINIRYNIYIVSYDKFIYKEREKESEIIFDDIDI